MSTPPAGDRREQIVDAALSLVRDEGIAAASVRNVAARAGIGASTLRYYFPSQRVLNETVAARLMDVQLDDLRIHDNHIDPDERLLECLAQLLGTGDDPALLAWLELVHSAATHGSDSLHAQLLAGLATVVRERVTGWLDVLAAEGHLTSEDLGHAATALLVRIDGLCLAMLAPSDPLGPGIARTILAEDIRALLAR